jgi:hypothetical protein
MGASAEQKPKDITQVVMEETERRLDTYYEIALPGEDDSPIQPMTSGALWLIVAVAIGLLALWLIGRFVVLPIYV